MGSDQKNFFVMLAASAAIFFGADFLLQQWRGTQAPPPSLSTTSSTTPSASSQTAQSSVTQSSPSVPGSQSTVSGPTLTREQALIGPRVRVETPSLKGSINLKGAVLDDLVLTKYHQTTQPKSPEIILLSPENTSHTYKVGFSWGLSGQAERMPETSLPPQDALWTADGEVLTPQKPVTLSWNNGQGFVFSQRFSIDDKAMVTVDHQVTNATSQGYTLRLDGHITRRLAAQQDGNFLLYEGPLGEFGQKLQEVSYDSLQSKGPRTFDASSKSWMGIGDKYWLVALLPDGLSEGKFDAQGPNVYNVTSSQSGLSLPAQGSLSHTVHVFAGAKVLADLDFYEKLYGLAHFDLAVDFGWFYFLTKPIFYALTWLKGLTGNFGLAILLFTVLLKVAFFPLTNRSYHTMARMKRLQPELEKLQERFKDDPLKLNQERLAFYKKQKLNPISGCLPMLLQMPAFFALYKVLFISIEMRHAPFWGWIHDLSAPDPTNIFTLFGLLPFNVPEFLHLGLWPLMMGATMFLQQRLNPPPVDPIQKRIFLYVMPGMFTYLSGQFASGLVIYWTWNNLISMGQQWFITYLDNRKIAAQKEA